MILQINYDLNKPGQNYDDLIKKIKSISNGWAKPCESCWLISTTSSPKEVGEILRQYTDKNDSLIVSRFYSNDYYGWLSKEIHDWIAQHKVQLRDITY